MKRTNKIDFKKASANMVERLEYVFRASVIDNWQRGKVGAIITFQLPPFTNSMDVCSEAGLSIAIAKKHGIINDGSVYTENDKVTVKLF